MSTHSSSVQNVKNALQDFYSNMHYQNLHRNTLEQYMTPPHLIADIVSWAKPFLAGRVVFDFGCGVGGFAVGSLLVGARCAIGFDIDPVLVGFAQEASKEMGPFSLHWIVSSVEFLPLKRKNCFQDLVVLMNPPFGTKGRRGIDRAFLLRAFEIANVVISMHRANPRSLEVFQFDAKTRGWSLAEFRKFAFPLGPTARHSQSIQMDVMVLIFTKSDRSSSDK